MNHYPRHIGDIAKDTAHLSQGQFGTYDLLLDWYYAHEKPLPLDKAFLYAITRAKSKAERANADAVLRWFFTETLEGWRQKRCDEELLKYAEKSAKATASASVRWSGRNANASTNAMRTHPERIPERNASHKPLASNQEIKVNSNVELTLDPPPSKRLNGHDKTKALRSEGVAILEFLNEKTGRTFPPVPANVDRIVARLTTYTADDIRSVIAMKCREWGKDEKMTKFLRPKTLFSAENFANYVGELANV